MDNSFKQALNGLPGFENVMLDEEVDVVPPSASVDNQLNMLDNDMFGPDDNMFGDDMMLDSEKLQDLDGKGLAGMGMLQPFRGQYGRDTI